jgi:hypothetical protein
MINTRIVPLLYPLFRNPPRRKKGEFLHVGDSAMSLWLSVYQNDSNALLAIVG